MKIVGLVARRREALATTPKTNSFAGTPFSPLRKQKPVSPDDAKVAFECLGSGQYCHRYVNDAMMRYSIIVLHC
jgi:hypothetical protein